MITLLIILGIILNTILSHLVGTTGEKKDIGYNTVFWISFLFSPLIGLLFSIASPNNPEKVSNRWYRDIENSNQDTVVKIVLYASVVIFAFYVLWNK